MKTTIANPSPVQAIGRASECMRRLMEAGLSYEDLQFPIDDPAMRRRLVYFWASYGYEPTTSQRRAREIMGRNLFGVKEAIKHFGVNPTKQQITALTEIPFSGAVLQECKDTHVLVAVFPLSILEIRGKMTSELFYDQSWYNKESFAKDCGDVSWQLVRKTPVSDSTSKSWDEQQALLAKNEETPTARIMVYTTIGHFLATCERLFEKIYVRCSDIDSDGYRVSVGDFGSGGLGVSYYSVGYRGGVGLAVSRKFQG